MNKTKNRYKTILTVVILPLLLAMCSKSSDIGPVLRTKVDLAGSTIEKDQAYARIMFSTDGGTTWSAAPPNLSVGTKYLVQALDDNNGLYLTPDNFYSVDWSKSSPKPNDAASGTPEFTFADNNNLTVSVVDRHCTFDPTSFTGDWSSTEVPVPGGCNCSSTEPQHITQDSSNPNKLIMDNYWGDGPAATVYMIFDVSTTAFDQTITIPQQVTAEGMTASGTGTYDQCRGTITLHAHYDQYEWIYNFKRP